MPPSLSQRLPARDLPNRRVSSLRPSEPQVKQKLTESSTVKIESAGGRSSSGWFDERHLWEGPVRDLEGIDQTEADQP